MGGICSKDIVHRENSPAIFCTGVFSIRRAGGLFLTAVWLMPMFLRLSNVTQPRRGWPFVDPRYRANEAPAALCSTVGENSFRPKESDFATGAGPGDGEPILQAAKPLP